MTGKDIFDGCTKLAEISAGRLDFRRQLEWRVSFAIWAVLVAGIAYFRVDQLPIVYGLILLFAYAIWLGSVGVRNKDDTESLWHYVHRARAILASRGISLPDPNRRQLRMEADRQSQRGLSGFLWRFLRPGWALVLQFIVTLGLGLFAYGICAESYTPFDLPRRLTP